MSKPHDYDYRLAECTDQALFDMLAHSDDYTPEAIDATKAEIHRRKLSPEQTSQLEAASRQLIGDEAKRAGLSLSWSARALMLFLSVPPVCVAPLIISEWHYRRGYRKKASQCLIWTGIGWLYWGFAIIVTGPHGYGLLLIPLAFVVAAVADSVVHFRRNQQETQDDA